MHLAGWWFPGNWEITGSGLQPIKVGNEGGSNYWKSGNYKRLDELEMERGLKLEQLRAGNSGDLKLRRFYCHEPN